MVLEIQRTCYKFA